MESNKEKNENYINDTREKQNVVDIICENVTGIIKLLMDYKPPPGAEFYLTPSTFVTNAQAIIEKQNKLNGQNNETENIQESENAQTNEENNITEEENSSSENKEQESSIEEKTNTNEGENKPDDEESKTNNNKEDKKEENNQESETDKKEPETTTTETNENNIVKEEPPSENDIGVQEVSDNTNAKPSTPDDESKNNTKLTEDVINLILNKPESNKVIDTEAGKNATVINLLSDNQVNSINLLEVLRYVEEKINELLVFNYMTHLPKRKDPADGEIKPTEKMFMSTDAVDAPQNLTLLGPGPEAPITNLNIKIPER